MPPTPKKIVNTVVSPITSNSLNPTIKGGFWSRVKKLDLDWNNFYLKQLVYGDSGTGKTSYASTFPAPILWLVCSGGTVEPDELWSVATEENKERIHPVNLMRTDEINELVDGWQPGMFKTLVVDHLGGCQDMYIKEVLGVSKLPEQKSYGLMSQDLWGVVSQQFKEGFAKMLDLPANIVWIAHEKVHKAKESKGNTNFEFDSEVVKDFVGPNLIPGLAGWVSGACNYVTQTYRTKKVEITKKEVLGDIEEMVEVVRGNNYVLRCQEMVGYAAKIRLPKKWADRKVDLVDPSYDKLMAMLKGEELPED